MGNVKSTGPPGSSPQDALAARQRFKARLAKAMGVPLSCVSDPPVGEEGEGEAGEDPQGNVVIVRVGEEAANELSAKLGIAVCPHVAVVSHCLAWKSGTELITRLPPDEADEAKTITAIQRDYDCWSTMQDEAKFRVRESTQMMMQDFDTGENGDKGALLVRDPIVAGNGAYLEDGTMDESGDDYDDDCFPAHFLAVHPLMPTEYAALNGVRTIDFEALLREHWSPIFISSPHRANHLYSRAFKEAFDEARRRSPVMHMSDGLTVDLRLRKQGTAVDILFSGRCMAHLLIPLNQAFDKETVPVGTMVGVQSEGGHVLARFHCHDSKGCEITKDTAHFSLDVLKYGNSSGGLVDVEEGEALELALLPPGELWATKKLIRMMVMSFYMPAKMLATMLYTVRENVVPTKSAVGYVQEWPEYFSGSHPPGGLLCKLKDRQEGLQCSFRFMCASIEYFEDEQYLDDDGNFVPPNEDEDQDVAGAGEGES